MIITVAAGCRPKHEAGPAEVTPVSSMVPASEESSFTVIFVIGEVSAGKAGEEKKLSIGDRLGPGDVVITGVKAAADLRYKDLGVVRIGESSECAIDSVADALSDNTSLKLEKGSVAATFGKLKKEKFSVSTQTVVAAVRGTSFVVATDGETSVVTVARGRVAVRPVPPAGSTDQSADLSALEVEAVAGEKVEVAKSDMEQVAAGTKRVEAEPMSKAELEQTKEAITSIKVEEAPELAPEVKDEIRKEVPLEIEKAVETVKIEEDRQAEDERIAEAAIAENRRKREAAAVRQREIEQQRELELLKAEEALAAAQPAEEPAAAGGPASHDEVAVNIAPEEAYREALDNATEVEFDSEHAEAHKQLLADTSTEQKRKAAPVIKVTQKNSVRLRPVDFSAKFGISVMFWGEMGSLDTGDWVEYTIDIPEEGDYTISYNLSSLERKGELELVAGSVQSKVKVPSSASGDIGGVLPVNKNDYVRLQAGTQTIRIRVIEGGDFTLNYITIKRGKPFTFQDFLNMFGGKKRS